MHVGVRQGRPVPAREPAKKSEDNSFMKSVLSFHVLRQVFFCCFCCAFCITGCFLHFPSCLRRVLGLQVGTTAPDYLCGFQGSNSGHQACTASQIYLNHLPGPPGSVFIFLFNFELNQFLLCPKMVLSIN